MAVGKIDSEGVAVAGELAALGIDPLRFLFTRSNIERNLLVKLRDEALEATQKMNQDLAVRIAEQVGKLFGVK